MAGAGSNPHAGTPVEHKPHDHLVVTRHDLLSRLRRPPAVPGVPDLAARDAGGVFFLPGFTTLGPRGLHATPHPDTPRAPDPAARRCAYLLPPGPGTGVALHPLTRPRHLQAPGEGKKRLATKEPPPDPR